MLRLDLQFFGEEITKEETADQTTAAEPKQTDTNPSNEVIEPSKTEPKPIPYERFKEVNDAYKSFKELGTPEELKTKLDALVEFQNAEEERKKAEMTEAERLKSENEEAVKKAEEAEEKVKQFQESANKRIIDTEIKSVARSLNANDPNDVLALLDKSEIKIDDEGNVSGIDDALKAFKESKPWLFKQPIGADASGGSNPHKNPSADELSAKEKELKDLQEQAKTNPKLLGKVTKIYNEIFELKRKK